MRYFICLLLVFYIRDTKAQLVEIGRNKHSFDKEKGLTFSQFKFRLVVENNIEIIKSVTSDSIFYNPEKRNYYETFHDAYLISTIIDTQIIKKGTSTAYCMFPRKQSYIMPINNIENISTLYCVDFNERVIMEDFNFTLPKEYKYFKIKEIDIEKLKVTICDREGKKVTLDLRVINL